MNHLSDSVSVVDVTHAGDGARRAHAARRRRAARHRLRRARAAPAPSSRPRIAVRTRRSTRPSRPSSRTAGHRPRRRLGVRRDEPRRDARRHARRRSSRSSATRRARSRSRPTAARSTRPSSTPATAPPTIAEGAGAERRRTGVGRAARRPTTNFQSIAGPRGRPDRPVRRRQLDRRARPQLEQRGHASRCPTRTSSRSTPTPIRRSQVGGPDRLLHRRRHDPLQHGRQPGEREGLRRQPRVAERRALRRAGHRSPPASSRSASRRRVRGHLAESRITVLDGGVGAAASPEQAHRLRHLLRRRSRTPRTTTASAFPLGMAVSSDGATLYVAGFGSSEVGVYGTAQLENDTFTPERRRPDRRERRRPDRPRARRGALAALRAHALRQRDLGRQHRRPAPSSRTSRSTTPSPRASSAGRPFLYDASFTSSHGDSACASCHIFGDFDSLAWDLGNPDDTVLNNPGPFTVGPFIDPDFHPMKGPMTTQSLRGMANHGPMHWRGDRTGGNDAGDRAARTAARSTRTRRSRSSTRRFEGLLGRSEQLTAGRDAGVHRLHPAGDVSAEPDPQPRQLAHAGAAGRPQHLLRAGLRHASRTATAATRLMRDRQRGLRRRGARLLRRRRPLDASRARPRSSRSRTSATCTRRSACSAWRPSPVINPGDNGFPGDQIRGFGFLHDGSVDTLFRFHNGDRLQPERRQPRRLPGRARPATRCAARSTRS